MEELIGPLYSRIDAWAMSKDHLVGAHGFESNYKISVWNRDNGNLHTTLKGHTNLITQLIIHGDRIISGSQDGTIKIWKQFMLEKTITAHRGAVTGLVGQGDKIITSEDMGQVKVWDINTGELIKALSASKDFYRGEFVRNIDVDGDRIVSGGLGGVSIWNINTGELIRKLYIDDPGRVALKGDFLVTSGAKRYNITKQNPRPTLLGKYQILISIYKDTVITRSTDLDECINLYNLYTGVKISRLRRSLICRYRGFLVDDYGIIAKKGHNKIIIYKFDLFRELKYPFAFSNDLKNIEGIQYEMEETPDTLEVHIQVEDHPLLLKITVMADGTYKVAKEGGAEVLECIVGRALCKKISQHKFTDIVKMIIAIYNKFDEKKWNKCVSKIKGPRTNNLKL